MRTTGMVAVRTAAVVAAALGTFALTPASAFFDTVPPFKGNDTGGIIAYSLFKNGADVKALAVNHCAAYGKSVKLTGVDAQHGGYISFACIWVHPGHNDRPLRVGY